MCDFIHICYLIQIISQEKTEADIGDLTVHFELNN